MNRTRFAGLSSLLTAAAMIAIPRMAHAVTTRFNAHGGRHEWDETVFVTMSDSGSRWKTTDFHADGINGNSRDYDYYNQDAGDQGGIANFEYFVTTEVTDASPGQYNCWAVAHGLDSSLNPWSAGVTSVNVTVTS